MNPYSGETQGGTKVAKLSDLNTGFLAGVLRGDTKTCIFSFVVDGHAATRAEIVAELKSRGAEPQLVEAEESRASLYSTEHRLMTPKSTGPVADAAVYHDGGDGRVVDSSGSRVVVPDSEALELAQIEAELSLIDTLKRAQRLGIGPTATVNSLGQSGDLTSASQPATVPIYVRRLEKEADVDYRLRKDKEING